MLRLLHGMLLLEFWIRQNTEANVHDAKFLYFVDNTAKCVSTFSCCKGTFAQTTWPFWSHSANRSEVKHGWSR